MRQLTWYPCEKIAVNSDYFLQMIPLPNKGLLAKGTQRSSKERDSNARRIRTTPWFVGSDWVPSCVFNDKVVNLPASSKGCCLNPKGWCIGTPYHPFSIPWKIQVLFQESPKNQTIKQSQSHIPNPGFMKVQRKNTTSEVTEGVRNHSTEDEA